MNALIVATLACLATIAYSVPSGLRTVVSGPAGVVTGYGAIGPVGQGWGIGQGVAVAAPFAAGSAVLGVPYGWGQGAINGWGLGYRRGVAAISAGHGSVSASAHGAAIRGPPTAPVVVAGPAGKIVANGLWGPTGNIGGNGALGTNRWW